MQTDFSTFRTLARTVANIPPKCSHITSVLECLRWLKIDERLKLISLIYQVLTTTQPTYLCNLISLQTDRNTCSSDVVTLAFPLKITDRCFQYAFPHSRINFLFYVVNQFHLLMLILTHLSLRYFIHPLFFQSFALNSKVTFPINLFHHRSVTIDTLG